MLTLTCYTKYLLSIESDFFNQKCEIEESIINFVNAIYHFLIYYPKYHC